MRSSGSVPATVDTTVQTERLGVAAVHKVVQKAGWFFREQPRPDEGIDAQIEAASDGRPNGQLLGLQIKLGVSYFERPIEGGGWRYRIAPAHLDYWRRYSLPVILVLYNPTTDTAYWQVIRSETLRRTADGGHTVDVPAGQEVGESVPAAFAELAGKGVPTNRADADDALRGRRAEFDVGWMEMIEQGDRLFLEAEQRLEGGSGRGSLKLVAEARDGGVRTEREWPWAFLPGVSYAEELRKIFPWADLRIDGATYRTQTYPAYVAERGSWNDDEEYYDFDGDFDVWFSAKFQGELLPYARRAGGGVALWRLELVLNEFGKATLRSERDAWYADATFDIELEESLAQARVGGHYETCVFESGARAVALECVVFVMDEDSETLIAERSLLTDESKRPAVAAAILQHALDFTPTDALVDAFVARYRRFLDGEQSSIEFQALGEWLDEMGVGGPAAKPGLGCV